MSSRGQTAMRHARELVALLYPSAVVLEAGRSVYWRDGRPFSRREDLFGCFDMLILGDTSTHLIQVTTWTGGGGPAARRAKVQAWAEEHFPKGGPLCFVYAWVPRRYMRRWLWNWRSGWGELPQTSAPPRRARKPASPPREPAPALSSPADAETRK